MKLVFQTAVLIISFIIIFLWQITSLSQFTVPILGILIASYLIVSSRKGGKGFPSLMDVRRGSKGMASVATVTSEGFPGLEEMYRALSA